MTFEEVKSKIDSSKIVSITEIKDIQHGKCICLNNGGKVNCYDTGKHNIQGKGQEELRTILGETIQNSSRKIFVVYGHDDIARTQLEALLRRWNLEPIILDQLASRGQTIIEKLEEYGDDVESAIVLATPDDEGKAKTESTYKSRFRQNVVLELGMFLGKLGRNHVTILLKETVDLETPSDIDGFIRIFYQEKIDEVSVELIRELNKQGYVIDTARI